MISADFIRKIDNARVMLSECRTSEEVERVFSEFGITGYPSKIALLRRCTQIQKTDRFLDNTISDQVAYETYLEIFLTGKWRDTNLVKESKIPDSNLSNESVKQQSRKSKEVFNVEEVYKDFNVSEEEYNFLKKFYKINILPRIQKKYLSQLISAIEDMIDEKVRKQLPTVQDKEHITQRTNRYKIILAEITPDMRRKTKAFCLVFPNHAVILYDPANDIKTIRVLIAHELGHLLSFHGIIPNENKDRYADLFAFFAIAEENKLYTSSHPLNFYSKVEILENIKALSSLT